MQCGECQRVSVQEVPAEIKWVPPHVCIAWTPRGEALQETWGH